MVRQYSWTISDALLSPDGVEKNMIVANGQYPGPLIEGLCNVKPGFKTFADSWYSKLG